MPCIEQVRAAATAEPKPPNLPGTSSPQPMSSAQSTRATASDNHDPPEQPETTALHFPSSIPPSLWTTGCIPDLVDKERRLRLAQADDGLNELRRQLRISATLLDYKKVQIGSSQKVNTRARTLLSKFHDKTMRCAERYSAAFKALSVLDPNGTWTMRLKFLDHGKDLRSPRRDTDDDPSESQRELSWIWLASREGGVPAVVASPDEINDSKSIFWDSGENF